jgi:hypothetical protein
MEFMRALASFGCSKNPNNEIRKTKRGAGKWEFPAFLPFLGAPQRGPRLLRLFCHSNFVIRHYG